MCPCPRRNAASSASLHHDGVGVNMQLGLSPAPGYDPHHVMDQATVVPYLSSRLVTDIFGSNRGEATAANHQFLNGEGHNEMLGAVERCIVRLRDFHARDSPNFRSIFAPLSMQPEPKICHTYMLGGTRVQD